jgi:hypothetical protein
LRVVESRRTHADDLQGVAADSSDATDHGGV